MDDSSTKSGGELVPAEQLQLFRDYVRVQGEEMNLRHKQLDLESQNQRDGFSFARESLAAQLQDRQRDRDHAKHTIWWTLVFSVTVLVVILIFAGFCLFIGKEQFVVEAMKVLLYGSGGGGVGYSLAKRQQRQQGNDAENQVSG